MWSLPNIQAMNQAAEDEATQAAIRRMAEKHLDESGRRAECQHCTDPATISYEWFDIFSDDPKGVIHLCEGHDGYYGRPAEGYFECDGCGRVFIENYTWELYYAVEVDLCETLCLNCHRERELAKPENWIKLTKSAITRVDFEQARKARHLLAVGQDCAKELEFIGNVEFDSMTGGKLTGFSSCSPTPDSGVEELREVLEGARAGGHKKAILVLDAAYQFAASIGVYVPARSAAAA